MRTILLIITGLFLAALASGQNALPYFYAYGGVAGGAGEAKPFWNVSKQYGRYLLQPFDAFGGIGLKTDHERNTNGLRLDYGVEWTGNLGKDKRGTLHEAYVEMQNSWFLIRAGKKEEITGNQDTTLSLGSTIWAGNARPMPMLVAGTPGYIDIPYTGGYAEVNALLAHGWFERDRYVKNVFLHRKHLHLRFGGDFFINGSLGLQHFAQWGGSSPDPEYGDLPSDLDACLRVFLARSGDPDNVHENEVINSLGNHLGSRCYRLDVKMAACSLGIYFQSVFEDSSGKSRPFNRDGIWGVYYRSSDREKIVNHAALEYLHTTWQSGPVHNIGDTVLGGNDNYFNHWIYTDGWTYHGMVLGTPLITSPVFNESGERGTLNNRVVAIHLGLEGVVGSLDYRSFFTYSVNKGLYSNPISPARNQFSWYFETTVPSVLPHTDLDIRLAMDIGTMYGNAAGVILCLRRTFDPFRALHR
ncbi:MAG: capsule assembly Wzi family protein [Bacteroidales bacterium]